MKALLLITLIISGSLYAADKTVKKSETEGGVVINSSLQKLMDIKGVKTIYDTCKKDNPGINLSENDRTQTVLSCLWKDVQKDDDLKKKVMNAYADDAKAGTSAAAGRAPASADPKAPKAATAPDIITKKVSVDMDYEKDPGVIALSKYYEKKLDEILDPNKDDIKKNIIIAVDHRKFIELYKSELGKTIISAFTSYCLDTDPATCNCEPTGCTLSCKIDSSKMKTDRDTNIKSLAGIDLDSNSLAAKKWKGCITSVPQHCIEATASNNTFTQDETVKRSCLIMDYVSSARKNIMLADAQNKFYDDLAKDRPVNAVQNTKQMDAQKSSSDAVLEVSSKDIETNMKEPMTQAKADMDACYKANADGSTGTITNAEACKKILSTNKEANENAIAELGMRQLAQQDILEKELDSSPDKVKDYLKQEGYAQTDIDAMTKKGVIDQTKQEIMDRYKNQKEAIVAEMAAKINAKTSSTEGKIDPQSLTDIGKIKAISEEMSSRTKDLSNLVKFDNIVSSYLQITPEGSNSKEVSRNTASLFGEVKDMSGDDAKALNKQIETAKLSAPSFKSGQTSATNLDIKTINNDFMKYSTQPEDPTKKK
ncbi:MAG: hypothetical protein H7177_13220 [Rhizobacter sp.]|nr:hypothetical protein [Bacteriovorax sp.]